MILAGIVAVVTVMDMVFDFGRRLQVYTHATSKLTAIRLKRSGEYDEYAEGLQLVENIDNQLLDKQVSIEDLVRPSRDT
jgi:hypothetical protein